MDQSTPDAPPGRPRPPAAPSPAARLTDFLLGRRRAVLTLTAILTALALWRASHLELRTSLAELLPEKHPALATLHELTRRLDPPSRVVLAIESPDPAANRRLVDDLVRRLTAAHLPEVLAVDAGIHDELTFFERHRFLYPSLKDLESALARLQREVLKRKNPAFVDLEDDDRPPPWKEASPQGPRDARLQELDRRYPDGYYALPDRHTYAVVIHVTGALFREHSGEEIVARIEREIAALGPTRYHPALKIGLTGDLVHAIEERRALESDLALASALCVALVCLSIVLFFGRLRLVPLAVTPALLAAAFAFALAELLGAHFNASTAFLGSIIVGNGINYAIVQLARYEEERALGRSVRDALIIALAGTWRATLIAALSAAFSYGALVVTSFRGFSQFGWIGGAGMVLSWLATILLLPPLCAYTDRDTHRGSAPRRLPGLRLAAPLLGTAARHPILALATGGLLSALAFLPLHHYLADPFEYDFRKIGNQTARDVDAAGLTSAAAIDRRLDPIFGRTLSPNFLLAERPEDTEAIRRALKAQPGAAQVLGDIATLDDWLPGPPALQKEKLVVLARIRALIDAQLPLLEERDSTALQRLRPPDDLGVLTAADLPPALRRYFTEADHTLGRVLVYFVRRDVSQWDGKVQLQLAELTHAVRLPDGREVHGAGAAAVFAAMLESIRRDGPIVTAVAFLGVVLLVSLVTWKRRGAYLVLLALLAGVLWMVGAAAALGMRINFLNFIALPITFGIGVDYAINVFLRACEEGPGEPGEQGKPATPQTGGAITATGAAVGLCSLTTIIGYAALLGADNQGLRSLGALAILGEFACLGAALVILPAALRLREIHSARQAASPSLTPTPTPSPST